MPRKRRAVDIWKNMKPPALRLLALAVFILFGVYGPLTVLMESEIHLVPWSFVIVQTVASGGLAASIILFGRRRWWAIVLIIAVYCTVMVLNSGGLSLVFDDNGMKVKLGTSIGAQNEPEKKGVERTFSPDKLQAVYTQRGIVGVGAIMMLALGYALFIRVIHSEVKQRARLETEVNIAKEIQESLIPDATLKTAWVRISGRMIPATEVGGDIYDVVQVSENQIAFAVADVTGHGVGAGILSAMVKSALRLQLQHDPSPGAVLSQVNNTIYQLADEKTFVTFAYALIDQARKTVFLATAGHPPILHLGQQLPSVQWYRDSNLALGMRPNISFSFREIPLVSGDRFIMYTDGLLEAANSDGEQFGTDRLEEVALKSYDSVDDFCTALASAVRQFSGRETFEDDLTIVCAQMT